MNKQKIMCIGAVVMIIISTVLFVTLNKKAPEPKTLPEKPPESEQKVPEPETHGKFYQKIICIDPGHGKTARKEKEAIYPGASEKKAANVSGAAGKILTEEELNLQVGLKLKARLEAADATVVITRTEHECDMSNIERAEFANKNNADIVVRLHADGSESAAVSGVSVLLPSEKRVSDGYLTKEIVQNSCRAGELILAAVCKNTGAKNRGTVERPDMIGFNWSAVPVTLLEMGFISNPDEEANMATDEYQEKIVSGIIEGLEEYFGIN